MKRLHSSAALCVLAFVIAGCSSPGSSGSTAVMTRESQQAMTPAQAITRLTEGNARFVAGRSVRRDLPAEARTTAAGQYPFAVVLTCIDSRTPPELIFDQGIGDIFAPRIAGNYAPTEIIGSIEFATKVVGARAILVLGHSHCGAIKGACDDVRMGNLTSVIQGLRPAVDSTPGFQGHRTSKDDAFVQAVAIENVRHTMARLRADSEIIRQLEAEGNLTIAGAMYDLDTGKVEFVR